MNDELKERRIHHWRGDNRKADVDRLTDKHICGMRVVRKGTGWQPDYFTCKFPPVRRFAPSRPQLPLDESEPDEKVLDEIYRTELLKRLPKVE